MEKLHTLGWEMTLRAWSAWSPGLETREAWLDWLLEQKGAPVNVSDRLPPVKSVPPRLRRRCSAAGKMALETGLDACERAGVSGADVNLVYGSRNGEIITLKALFEDLYVNEPLSPTRFSNSVHHTPTGYFSLITKNRRISRTVSGGEDCFACGLLESISLLAKDTETPVLFFYCDEFSPEPFDVLLEKPEFPFSAAFVLANQGEGETIRLTLDHQDPNRAPVVHQRDPVFSFLAWLEKEPEPHTTETSFGRLTWRR